MVDRDDAPVVTAVVDALRDGAEQLLALSRGLEHGLAPTVTPGRLILLAAPLLALLAQCERETHRLAAFTLPLPPRKPEA